jgi:hypothetical protein
MLVEIGLGQWRSPMKSHPDSSPFQQRAWLDVLSRQSAGIRESFFRVDRVVAKSALSRRCGVLFLFLLVEKLCLAFPVVTFDPVSERQQP